MNENKANYGSDKLTTAEINYLAKGNYIPGKYLCVFTPLHAGQATPPHSLSQSVATESLLDWLVPSRYFNCSPATAIQPAQ